VNALFGVLAFVVFTGGLIGFVVAATAFGRWRGWGDTVAPEISRPPRSQWPLPCRLHVFHRWRTYRVEEARYQRCIGCGRTRDVPAIPPV
jgi:hypothetical protein